MKITCFQPALVFFERLMILIRYQFYDILLFVVHFVLLWGVKLLGTEKIDGGSTGIW